MDADPSAGSGLPARGGWHRPVRRRHVVLVMTGVVLVWVVVVAGAAWTVRERWQTEVSLRHQPVTLRLPTGMPASAQVSTPLLTSLDLQSKIAVPINQMVSVQLMNKLGARATINTSVPVNTSIVFEQDIPVSTEVEMKVPLVSWLPAMNVTVPVNFSVPVHMTVPIQTQVPLSLDMQVTGQLSEALKVPIRTTMHLNVPVHAKLRAEVLSQADFNLVGLQAPFELMIDQAHVRLPLSDLSWCHSITCVPSSTTWFAGKR
jgi:hypothetical protein